MKRSEINEIILHAREMFHSYRVVLPDFANWNPAEFLTKEKDAQHIINARLGWDITDYGAGDFEKMGLFLFTVRNGLLSEFLKGDGRCYAEKIMISRKDQLSPMHKHLIKVEDIINRGGGKLVVELFGSDGQGNFDPDQGGQVLCDGIFRAYRPGEKLILLPGESITLRPGDWHAFWGDGGDVLVGEISSVNDDETDNVFRDPISRFSEVIEDEAPLKWLVSDYAKQFG